MHEHGGGGSDSGSSAGGGGGGGHHHHHSEGGWNTPDPFLQGGFAGQPGGRDQGPHRSSRGAQVTLWIICTAFTAFMIYDVWYIATGH